MWKKCCFFILASCCLLTSRLSAQESQAGQAFLYPQDYFRNPLDIPIVLAGNFGECRPGHFHSGLDIKTNGRENLRVYAAADGYISRIRMDKGGFGHALYITHPEGFTTVYAHLNDFAKPVQEYTRARQYEKESWTVDLSPEPELFPVKKGELIAWSGNTGSSAGPHLHFEIRDSQTEHPLNPQLFGFTIPDAQPPVPLHLAVYNMEKSIYQQTPSIFQLVRSNDKYILRDTVKIAASKVGIAVHANDFMNGSTNTLNFFSAEWFLNDSLQGRIYLDDIGYGETRYLHAYADYSLKKKRGQWFQCLFRLPGNQLHHIYRQLNPAAGLLTPPQDAPARVRILLKDLSGNTTEITFILLLTGSATDTSACNEPFRTGVKNEFLHPNIRFSLAPSDLYQDICFQFEEKKISTGYSARYQIHRSDVPVHGYFDLFIKPDKIIPFALRNKIAVAYRDGTARSAKAAAYEQGWYTIKTRDFGSYQLVADTLPPAILPGFKPGADLSAARRIQFTVTEETTSVSSFRAELNGKWLCFEPRGNTFFYIFDAYCPKGKHKLKITVSDENNNTRTETYTFTR